jgi:hypothetical protein
MFSSVKREEYQVPDWPGRWSVKQKVARERARIMGMSTIVFERVARTGEKTKTAAVPGAQKKGWGSDEVDGWLGAAAAVGARQPMKKVGQQQHRGMEGRRPTMLVEGVLAGARLAADAACELSLLRVRPFVPLAVPVTSERLVADIARELLDTEMGLAMSLEVGLRRQLLPTDVTLEPSLVRTTTGRRLRYGVGRDHRLGNDGDIRV